MYFMFCFLFQFSSGAGLKPEDGFFKREADSGAVQEKAKAATRHPQT